MRKFTIYIFLLLCFLTACQRVELEGPSSAPEIPYVSGEATISFSVTLPGGMAQTKAMGDSPVTDINNLYLIIFDSNGYYVESRQAEITNRVNNMADFKVTLTMTNQKRIIHFVANCPVNQVGYGHESEVISKLYVKKGESIETAYWHRIEVPYIIADKDGNLLNSNLELYPKENNPFYNVPLLRNYTQITVEDNDDNDDNFLLLSYAVYNTIDIGTVAPYNKSKAAFQMFGEKGLLFSYDRLLADGFEGHVLTSAVLDSELTEDDFMTPGTPYYLYERKISVRHDAEESEWAESPTHIIIKGIYTGKGYENNTTPTYYKVDLIREMSDGNQYYNLLRNFDYTFRLRSVTGAGYTTWELAMENPAGNNLAGSTQTQKLTDVSDGTGRIMVSYTDTTLVSNHDIEFKFKYIPDITKYEPSNRQVSLVGELDGTGNVLKGLKYTIDYGEDSSDGWATVTFRVNDPTDIKQVQKIVLNVGENLNLQKTITFTLMKPYTLDIICYDPNNQGEGVTFEEPDNVIETGIGKLVGVALRIPDDLTRDMFPLEFMVEADKLSISPDVSEGNTVPVISGQSIIPGKTDPSFHYLFTIETYEIYQSLLYDEANHKKFVITRWLTNMVNSASYVVVDNKYFNIAASYFRNSGEQEETEVLGHKKRYTDLRIDPNPVFYGVDQPVKIMFDLDSREQKYLPKTVRVRLEGMVCTKHGDTEFDMFLSENPMTDTIGRNLPKTTKIVKMQKGTRSVIVDGLKTTVASHSDVYDGKGTSDITDDTGPIRFTLNPENPSEGGVYDEAYYQVTSDVANRIEPAFTMLMIEPNPVLTGENIPVSIRFYMDADDEDYFNRDLTIHLDGLKTAHRGLTRFDVRPAEGSIKILIDSLVTSTVNGNVSFTVVDNGGKYNAESGKSKVATRENADFWGLTINPSKVAQGVGKKLSISFNMDEDDKNFATREITVNLTGMKYVHPQTKEELTELVFTPSQFPKLTRYMTIGDLVTTSDADEVSFTVSTSGYDDATARAQRSEVEFKNLSFTRDGDIVSRINEGETVDFNFTMSYYEPGMTVNVTLDGFEPYDMPASGDGSLVLAATRAATSYVFTPFEKNCKLKLRAINTTSSSYSVGLAAESYGFKPADAGISKAIHKFEAIANTYTVTSSNTVTITFKIPANAWEAGQTTMPVNITLDRLVPADNKLNGSNGNYVYNVTKDNSNSYNFTVKPSETTAGPCKVTLNADYFIGQIINITQIVRTSRPFLEFDFNSGNNQPFTWWGTNNASVGINNQRLRVEVRTRGAEAHTEQLAYNFGSGYFVTGREYYLTFTISGTNRGNDADNKIYAYLQNNSDNYKRVVDFGPIEVPSQPTKITVSGVCTGTGDYLVMHFGYFVGEIFIDDFELGYYE
ncbi:MAG: hypothetical protein IKW11_05535 [Bacteroidales bacterium]|nr:hypothetical protein [Bacteroidales bacterium]